MVKVQRKTDHKVFGPKCVFCTWQGALKPTAITRNTKRCVKRCDIQDWGHQHFIMKGTRAHEHPPLPKDSWLTVSWGWEKRCCFLQWYSHEKIVHDPVKRLLLIHTQSTLIKLSEKYTHKHIYVHVLIHIYIHTYRDREDSWRVFME